jgi:carboxypeptidase C (cathepsin A)
MTKRQTKFWLCAALFALPLHAYAVDAAKAQIQGQYDEERHESKGSVTVGGKHIDYTTVAGTIAIEDKKNQPGALMSYVAYFKKVDGPQARRPITFFYNGGPGSATVWLHMGAFGPKRVITGDGVRVAPAPYPVVDNEFTPLDVTDMVFIDAPGTGYGRVGIEDKNLPVEADKLKQAQQHNEDLKRDFYGVDTDARAFDIFITKFLSRFERWNSPKYLFGESYGTTRSAVLAAMLTRESNIDLNGVMLLSQILNFGFSADRASANPGNDMPYILSLPSYAATAWYHKRVANAPAQLEPFLATVEKFALTDYAQALAQGDNISAEDRRAMAARLHDYIGLPAAYIEKANLRIDGGMFSQNLLADQGLMIGRLDARYVGAPLDPLGKESDYDPQSTTISSAYVSAYNDYSRATLGFAKDLEYKPTGGPLYLTWDFSHKAPGAMRSSRTNANVMPDLAAVMKLNPGLKVALFCGYYDLATLFYASEYEMNHLGLSPELHNNIEVHHYKTGHMIYVSEDGLKDIHEQIVKLIRSTSK